MHRRAQWPGELALRHESFRTIRLTFLLPELQLVSQVARGLFCCAGSSSAHSHKLAAVIKLQLLTSARGSTATCGPLSNVSVPA